jgi:hypothetical protein
MAKGESTKVVEKTENAQRKKPKKQKLLGL